MVKRLMILLLLFPAALACETDWTCTDWSSCSDLGYMTRTCADLNACNMQGPIEIKKCDDPEEYEPINTGTEETTDSKNAVISPSSQPMNQTEAPPDMQEAPNQYIGASILLIFGILGIIIGKKISN